MKAVVLGATGLVGSHLTKLLLEDEGISEVVLFVRREVSFSHEKLKVVLGELSELSSRRDELKGDIYFCCVGTTIKSAGSQENFRKVDYHSVMAFARIAMGNKGRKFLLISASSADAQSRIFYNRVKGETEKALKDLKLSSLIIFRPGLLLGDREEKRPLEKFAITSFRFFRHFIPEKMERKIATSVLSLVARMLSEAKSDSSGLQVIEAENI